jgi:hypothetical protein
MGPGVINQAAMQPELPLYLRPTDISSSERNVFVERQGWIAARVHTFRQSTLLDQDKFIAKNHGTYKRTVKTLIF